jgi:hypothetical protein
MKGMNLQLLVSKMLDCQKKLSKSNIVFIFNNIERFKRLQQPVTSPIDYNTNFLGIALLNCFDLAKLHTLAPSLILEITTTAVDEWKWKTLGYVMLLLDFPR